MTLTTSAFAQSLAEARSLDDGLRVLRAHLDEVARGVQLVYFPYDVRRQIVSGRLRPTEKDVVNEPVELSLDHLPAKLRREVLAGGALVDFGEQSADYLKFFGIDEGSDAFLLMQGLRFDGELYGIVALREPRQRFGSRAVERVGPPVGIFALAVAHSAERAARAQAEHTVEDILRRVHEEYGRALAELRRQLDEVKQQLDLSADARMVELQRAARGAADEARAALARLSAVEQQVSAAVSQLEKAHLDLSRQSQALRKQGELLHGVERLLREGGEDPARAMEDALAAMAARSAIPVGD